MREKPLVINGTKQWGPVYWKFLHMSAIFYEPNPKSRRIWRQFIRTTLPEMIPCGICQDHFKKFIAAKKNGKRNDSIAVESTRNLMLFFFEAHNASHSKKMSLKEFKRIYGNFLPGEGESKVKISKKSPLTPKGKKAKGKKISVFSSLKSKNSKTSKHRRKSASRPPKSTKRSSSRRKI